MSFDADTLMRLLPAIHRIRDAEVAAGMAGLLTTAERTELDSLEQLPGPNQAQQTRLAELRQKAARGPLRALLTAFADELAVVEENLAQLYDDQFIETCADWAIPYIGDLIGYEPLHGLGQSRALARAEVAHTIALRRRKGTAAALEQLARDVTGWNARAVEFFQQLGATQYMNHLRPHSRHSPELRRWEPLARIGSAFDCTPHTVDVRSIQSRRGRHNIPNVGLFLWRLDAFRHTANPAVQVDARRYLVSPLGHPLQLFGNPLTEDAVTHIAEPINVPEPIGRRVLDAHLPLYYGTCPALGEPLDNADPSIVLCADGNEVPRSAIAACHLADWTNVPPPGKYGIDPVLGRVAVAPDLPEPKSLKVTYHYGFSAQMGGGEYDRPVGSDADGVTVASVPTDAFPTIADALDALDGDGVVEILDSGRYEETLSVAVKAGKRVHIRAAPQRRPTVVLGEDMIVTGESDSEFAITGLLIAGAGLRSPAAQGNRLQEIHIAHSTLVPGLALDGNGDAVAAASPSLVVESTGTVLEVERSIVGAVWIAAEATMAASDSIIDANAPAQPALRGPTADAPSGALTLTACTVIGTIDARELALVSNCLLLAQAPPGATTPPVNARRRQVGCVRFTYLPFAARVPRRHQCQPDHVAASDVAPHFTSLRYGVAGYCQLARSTPDAIRRGADDESEMGAFHSLFAAQRESNLETRLQEYLRVGLSAGIFYET